MAGPMVIVQRLDGSQFRMKESAAKDFLNRSPGASILGPVGAMALSPRQMEKGMIPASLISSENLVRTAPEETQAANDEESQSAEGEGSDSEDSDKSKSRAPRGRG